MPEAVAAAIAPINATGSEPAAKPVSAPAEGKKSAKPMSHDEARLLEVMGQVNAKHGGDANEFKSLGEITDEVQARENGDAPPEPKAAPKAKPAPETPGLADEQSGDRAAEKDEGTELDEAKPKPPPKPAQKEKLKVGDQEFELDAEQVKRFAQKGIFYEKKNVDMTKREQTLAQKEAHIAEKEQHKEAFFNDLAERPGEVLEQIFGPEIFAKLKPQMAQFVQKEMDYEANPQQKEIDQANERAQAAEAQIAQQREADQQKEVSARAEILGKQYTETIIKALGEEGIPKDDYTAAEMARLMNLGLDKKIEYTPAQLAKIVKENNTVRVRSLTGKLSTSIQEARKSNDQETVLKCGQQLEDLLGPQVTYALSKYLTAKIRSGQPNLPAKTLEAAAPAAKKTGWGKDGKQYMTEDEARDMRQKIARGEMEPPPGW